MDPDRLFKTVLAEASAAGADEADVYLVDSRGTTVQVNKQEVESVKQSRDTGYGVRVLKDHRMASFHSASFDLQEVASGVRRAVEIAGLLPQDELLGIPEPTAVSDVDLQLVDPDLKALTTDQRVAVAMEIEKRALDVDPQVITDFVIFEDATVNCYLATSRGFKGQYEGTRCGGFCLTVTKGGGVGTEMMEYSTSRFFSGLDTSIGERAARKAIDLRDAKSFSSAGVSVPVIFPAARACQLIESLAPAFHGDEVVKGRSFLEDKPGSRVGSEILTMVDDGTIPKALGTAPFDGEGVPTSRTVLVERGVLKIFLMDTRTARKRGDASTGNAGRRGYANPPAVSHSNLHLQAGRLSLDDLRSQVDKAIEIYSMTEMGGIDTVSGDLSVEAKGALIEGGKEKERYNRVTLAGTVPDLLAGVKAVGNDLTWQGGIGCPSLLIEGLVVSGE